MTAPHVPNQVLDAWGWRGCKVTSITGGLINQTFAIERETLPIAVLQQMHPIFGGEVNLDITAVRRHLVEVGADVQIPAVLPTRTGALWHDHQGQTWRALAWLPGLTVHRVLSPQWAFSAGGLVGRFHRALDGFDHRYAFARPGVHDTARHLARLQQQLAAHAGTGAHAPFAEAEEARALAQQITTAAAALPPIEDLTPRHCHGDLKISNLLFTATDHAGAPTPSTTLVASALVDLDTVGMMPLAHELGDALRSWCNPLGEDDHGVAFRTDIFEAAMQGYAEAAPLTPALRRSIVAGLATICVELAARFCADVFADSYFGWDAARFPSRRAHNLRRARRQLELGQAVKHQASALLARMV